MTNPSGNDHGEPRRPGGLSRRRFLQGAAGGAALLYGSGLGRTAPAGAVGSNPISVENRSTDPTTWTEGFRLGAGTYNTRFGAFATRTSVNRGETFEVAINDFAPPAGAGPATLEIYRLGFYGAKGGRKVRTIAGVAVGSPGFYPAFDRFGNRSLAAAWPQRRTIATNDLVSGVYLIKVISSDAIQHHIPFVVREDSRARDLLVVMPTNTWQAYNNSTFKSLYNVGDVDTHVTVTGEENPGPGGLSRAAKVSFDRPWANQDDNDNWVLRSEFPLIYWLERQGYDVTYTDDVALDSGAFAQFTPPQTKTLAFAGHAEYWTPGMFDRVVQARDAGTNIASFSANAAYWQVRYEQDRRTLVCFKTVQGTTSVTADEQEGVNDFGPDNDVRSAADDPLGPDGGQGGGNDVPTGVTTTFRDPGVAPGAGGPDNAPPGAYPTGRGYEGLGRVGPNRSENELWGALYVGDHDEVSYPLQVPAGAGGGGEFSAHSAWRHTTIANAGGSIGNDIVGWEWDAVPTATTGPYAPYTARQPAGVKRLSQTNPGALTPNANLSKLGYLRDEGSLYEYGNRNGLPDGQGPNVHAVTYRAPSGALVFSAGTLQWSWGLGPHFDARGGNTYSQPPVDSSQAPIQQATYNILADGGVKPVTPEGIIEDAVGPSPATGPSAGPPADAVVAPPTTRPPAVTPPDRTPPEVTVGRKRRRATAAGTVRVRATAPGDKSGVVGTLALFAEVPRRSRSGRRLKPRRIKLGTRRLVLGRAQEKVYTMKLSKANRRLLAKHRFLRIVAETRVSDMAGNRAVKRTAFRLYWRPRKRSRRRSS